MRARVGTDALRIRRFRAASRAWSAGAPRRLALARLHGQMALLAQAEANALEEEIRGRDPYGPFSPSFEEAAQLARLENIGEAASDRMHRLAPARTETAFYDFVFAELSPAPGRPA